MSDEDKLAILADDGPLRWNSWRRKNSAVALNFVGAALKDKHLADALLSGVNLSGADFSHANLTGADLSNANLSGANFTHAHLNLANLSGADLSNAILDHTVLNGCNAKGANFENCNMKHAFWENAKLEDANLRGASFPNAVFNGATFNENTLGLGNLSKGQKGTMKIEEAAPEPTDAREKYKQAVPLTVKRARNIVGPAHLVLQHLSIPNDFDNEDHLKLFLEMRRTVEEIQEELANLKKEN